MARGNREMNSKDMDQKVFEIRISANLFDSKDFDK